jgi:hypothetical protein
VLADGGLCQVQNCRGAVKSATVGYCHDTAQGRDVEDLSHGATVLRSAQTIKERAHGAFFPHDLINRSPFAIEHHRE